MAVSIFGCDKTGEWKGGGWVITRLKIRVGFDPDIKFDDPYGKTLEGVSVIGSEYGITSAFCEIYFGDGTDLSGSDVVAQIDTDARLDFIEGDKKYAGTSLAFTDGATPSKLGLWFAYSARNVTLTSTYPDGSTKTKENPNWAVPSQSGVFRLYKADNGEFHVRLGMRWRSAAAWKPYDANATKISWNFTGSTNLTSSSGGGGYVYSPNAKKLSFNGYIQPWGQCMYNWGDKRALWCNYKPLFGPIGSGVEVKTLDTSLHPYAVVELEDGTKYRGIWMGTWYGGWKEIT